MAPCLSLRRGRQSCPAREMPGRGAKKGTPSAESLFLAGWVLVFTTLAPAVLSAQTIMALYRCRWQVEIAIKRWKSVLDVDALRAKANSPLAGVAPWEIALCVDAGAAHAAASWGDSWGRLDRSVRARGGASGVCSRRAGTDDYRRPVLEGGAPGQHAQGVDGTAAPQATSNCRSSRASFYRCDAGTQEGCPWQPNGMVPRGTYVYPGAYAPIPSIPSCCKTHG